MKKQCFLGLTVLLAISGIFIYKNADIARSNGLTPAETEEILREYREGNPNGLTSEQIREVLKEYAESNPGSRTKEEIYDSLREYVASNYGPGTEFSIVSYGQSGVGYINHETGEVMEYVTDPGDER
ncbi:MAG: hypothetical protein K2O97_05900 [Acetatifactor sp.]|nr:hypothetical protein [Acetatifactor sp.]